MADGTKRIGWVLGISAACALGGCAEERDPIFRVQPNAISKHFFVGQDLEKIDDDPEFYMRNTVVDVPYAALQEGLFTASYAQPLSRIKWEIQETELIARLTYERIENTDHHGSKRTNDGQVVAAFKIESQFDVARQYNSQTGEEYNVIEENTTDRPWFQREYIRVDWSKNLVTDAYELDTLSQLGLYGGVKWSPLAYKIEDPKSADKPVFEEKAGYFDVTTKAFATPEMIETPYGTYPACFFYTGGIEATIDNCNATEVTLRLSFKKVVDTDYEPTEWTGSKQDAFGWFLVERFGYDRSYGIVDERWRNFATKYNIWEKNHIDGTQCAVDKWRDADGQPAKYRVEGNGIPVPDPNGQEFTRSAAGLDVHRLHPGTKTEEECYFEEGGKEIHAGARCDEFSHKCSLPLHERKLKTIPWFFAPGSPEDLFASTAEALSQWNVAVKRAALIGQNVSASRSGAAFEPNETDEAALLADSKEPSPKMPNLFVLCHSPSIEGDPDPCFTKNGDNKEPIFARIGDLRYNTVNLINSPQTGSPWGIMVDANDPLTGENVSTSVNEWIAVLDNASQNAVDLIRWKNGEIGDNEISGGAYLHEWAEASKLGSSQFRAPTLAKDEIASRIASIDPTLKQLGGLSAEEKKRPSRLRKLIASKRMSQSLGPSLDSTFLARRKQLIGTKHESRLLTPNLAQLGGLDPRAPLPTDDASMARISPLRGKNPALRHYLNRLKNSAFGRRGSCVVEAPEPTGIEGLAKIAEKKFPLPAANDPNAAALRVQRNKDMHQWIREQFNMGVLAHEMGHSVGLRHNFVGNTDPLNYHTEYWQLRTRNGAEKACLDFDNKASASVPHADGHECVGPRWIDPITNEEVDGVIWRYGTSTVMDYPGDLTQDLNGLGPYDKAAMRFGYANLADVDRDTKWNERIGDPRGDKAYAYVQALDGFGGILGQTLSWISGTPNAPNYGSLHYSQYADKVNVLGKCTGGDGKDPLTAKCSGFDLAYVSLDDMKTVDKYDAETTKVRPDLVSNFAVDEAGHVRHPYMFGSDEYAEGGNISVQRFDGGADPYEQAQFLVSLYENRYVFDYFRRNRVTFDSENVVNRVLSRAFEPAQGFVKALALGSSYQDPNDAGDGMPLALAGADAMQLFVRVLTRPEPGAYTLQTLPSGKFAEGQTIGEQLDKPGGDFSIAVGSGQGRFLQNDYDFTKGYWWSSYQKQVGSYYEKLYAIYFLIEAENNFIQNSKDDYIDGRSLNLNFVSVYPNQVRRLFANMMQNDPMTLGPYTLDANRADGKPATVRYLAWDKFDAANQILSYPANAVVLNPLVGWEQQYPSLVFAYIYGVTQMGMDFINQMRVWSPGGGSDSLTVPVSEQVQFVDPFTGITYVARTYGKETINGQSVERAAGARMIQYANKWADDHFSGKDANNEPICKKTLSVEACTSAKVQMRRFAGNLDVARELAAEFAYGPL